MLRTNEAHPMPCKRHMIFDGGKGGTPSHVICSQHWVSRDGSYSLLQSVVRWNRVQVLLTGRPLSSPRLPSASRQQASLVHPQHASPTPSRLPVLAAHKCKLVSGMDRERHTMNNPYRWYSLDAIFEYGACSVQSKPPLIFRDKLQSQLCAMHVCINVMEAHCKLALSSNIPTYGRQ